MDKTYEDKQSKKELSNLKKALDESSIVAITDKEGKITYVNDKFCNISKYSRSELIGQNHRILKSEHHPDSFYTNLWNTISSGSVWNGDILNKAKDGSYYWVRTTLTPLIGSDGKPEQYVAIRTDVSELYEQKNLIQTQLLQLKKTEKELTTALKDVKQSELKKEEFSSMIAHELKTPLTPIKGYCEMLLDEESFGSLTTDQFESVKNIEENALSLEHLIGELLDAQKLDMLKMTYHKKSFEITPTLTRFGEDLAPLMRDKEIKFTIIDLAKCKISTDIFRLRQIFVNLVRNSVDFVPETNGEIEVGAKIEDNSVLFYVKDNGVGIPKEVQSHLFEKYYQADTSDTRKHGGTGLGLTICKGIVEGLGGKIWFESEIGKGTTFYFTLPKD